MVLCEGWLAVGTSTHTELSEGAANLVLLAVAFGLTEYTRVGWLEALLGIRAAVGPTICARRLARLPWDHTNLGEGAADFPFRARVFVILAGGLCRSEASFSIGAAIF